MAVDYLQASQCLASATRALEPDTFAFFNMERQLVVAERAFWALLQPPQQQPEHHSCV